MKIKVSRSSPLSGSFSPPGDKSISHRAVLLGALGNGISEFTNFLNSGVTQAMIHSLEAFGMKFERNQGKLIVHGQGFRGFHAPLQTLDCGHSGTTMRLLTGALTAANLRVILDGSKGLRQRPMSRVIDPLRLMGAKIDSNNGKAPITINPRSAEHVLRGITYEMPVPSAQVKSALLLAGLAAREPSEVIEAQPSRDHTEQMLSMMGVGITTELIKKQYRTSIKPMGDRPLKPISFHIPGDISSAAFLITATYLLPQSNIQILDVGLNWTRTGFLDALTQMGADITIKPLDKNSNEKSGDLEIAHTSLQNTKIPGDMVVRMIDEFPTFAVLAAFSKGLCELRDAKELRHKESDRIRGICLGLSKLGIQIDEREDGFRINGDPKDLPGGVVLDPGQDHRIAMAFVLAGLRAKEPVIVKNAEIIKQSFPEFIAVLQKLGVDSLEVIHE